jgi:hypothetical protein
MIALLSALLTFLFRLVIAVPSDVKRARLTRIYRGEPTRFGDTAIFKVRSNRELVRP